MRCRREKPAKLHCRLWENISAHCQSTAIPYLTKKIWAYWVTDLLFLHLLQANQTCTSAGIMKAAKNDENQWHFSPFLIYLCFQPCRWVKRVLIRPQLFLNKACFCKLEESITKHRKIFLHAQPNSMFWQLAQSPLRGVTILPSSPSFLLTNRKSSSFRSNSSSQLAFIIISQVQPTLISPQHKERSLWGVMIKVVISQLISTLF